MAELTPKQVAVLERFSKWEFRFVAFPLYAGCIGLRKGNCAALLQPVEGGGMRLLGDPCYLVDGNLSVRVRRSGRQWFVWKKKQIEATPERLSELERFSAELKQVLHPPS